MIGTRNCIGRRIQHQCHTTSRHSYYMIRLLHQTSRPRTTGRRPTERRHSPRSSIASSALGTTSSRVAWFGTDAGGGGGNDGVGKTWIRDDGQTNDSSSSSSSAWKTFPDGSRFWKDTGGGHHQRPIFVAATKQHVGKTTTSLAIMSGLQKRFGRVGFIKPVGQQHVEVNSGKGDEMLRVDKDVCLVKEHFRLEQ